MFRRVKVKSRKEYFDSLPEERRKVLTFLDELIQKTAPNLIPNFIYNMPGYGSFPYKNYKNQIIDWPIIAIANQKNYISLYVCSIYDGKYLAEIYKNKLGKVSVGKSCIRFKKLEDLQLSVLKKIIIEAAKRPGLT